MKTLTLGALALTVAVPAMAQPAQPQNHQGHQMPAPATAPAQHQGRDMARQGGQGGQAMDHSQMADCCGDANGNGKMDCCENMAANGGRDCCAEHAQHQQSAPAQPANR